MAGSDSPVFVVGAPRSGTSLMRRIINSHKAIAMSDETHYFFHFYEPYRTRGMEGWRQAVDSFLAECARIQPADYRDVNAQLEALAEPDFRLLFELPLSTWASAEGKERWGEKTPRHIFYADVLIDFFPGARFILMLRDPRGAVASMNRFSMIRGKDSVFHAKRWQDVWTEGYATASKAIPEAQRITIRYEELIADARSVLGGVCEFLGEEDDTAAMLGFYKRHDDSFQGTQERRWSQAVSGDAFSWRSDLSPREVSVVEAVCGVTMEHFGYKREAEELTTFANAEVRTKLAYAGLRQRQHRHERYHVVSKGPLAGLRHRTKLPAQ